jgi:hypothetical protein
MRRQATKTLVALGASALALILLVATVGAAARWIQVQPVAGAPGTHVHVVITDTAAVRLTSTLAMYPYRSDFGCCTGMAPWGRQTSSSPPCRRVATWSRRAFLGRIPPACQ